MAEEIEMLFDCAACMWCKPAKTHLLSKLPFDFVCKVVQFLSDRCEHRKHPPSEGAGETWTRGMGCRKCQFRCFWHMLIADIFQP